MRRILEKLYEGGILTTDEAFQVMTDIGEGRGSNEVLASLLTVYRMRPITAGEFSGFRSAMYELSNQVRLESEGSIDIVGTGGDGKNTFNISTLSCVVLAGAGYKVTKHGNYAASSISGSSNLLQKLGYQFTNDRDVLQRQLDNYNLCFLHAPLFHPAMKYVAPVRTSMGVKTIFNIMGPVINPSKPKAIMLGTYCTEVADLYAEVMEMSDYQYAIVHSLDGYDEISLTDKFLHYTREYKTVRHPQDHDFALVGQEELFSGETIDEARDLFISVLKNETPEPRTNVILINSGIAIHTLHPEKTIEEGIREARESIESGRAYENLMNLLNNQ